MTRWIVIHKPDETATDWGFSSEKEEIARATVDSAVVPLRAGQAVSAADLGWPNVMNVSAVVLSRGRCDDLAPKETWDAVKEWLQPLADESCRIWVHFGGESTHGMTQDTITRRWKDELTAWHFLAGKNSVIRPYSVDSGGLGNDGIRQARVKLSGIVNGTDSAEDVRAFSRLPRRGVARLRANFGNLGQS